MKFRFALTLAALLAAGVAHAHDYRAGDMHVDHPYARPSAPGQANGAAYLQLASKVDDALVAASSPACASVEIHAMSMEGDVMKMRALDKLEVPAGAKVEMKPGDGYHLMLMGLKKPLKNGDKFPMTLQFRKAGKLVVSVTVGMPPAPAMHGETPHDHGHAHHEH